MKATILSLGLFLGSINAYALTTKYGCDNGATVKIVETGGKNIYFYNGEKLRPNTNGVGARDSNGGQFLFSKEGSVLKVYLADQYGDIFQTLTCRYSG